MQRVVTLVNVITQCLSCVSDVEQEEQVNIHSNIVASKHQVYFLIYLRITVGSYISSEICSGIYMWQSRIEFEYYSVLYFECITDTVVLSFR